MNATIAELGRQLRSGQQTCATLVEHSLDAVRATNSTLHAVLEVFEQRARRRAKLLDIELSEGKSRGPLHGIPFGVKDIFDVEGSVTTCQSWIPAREPAATSSESVRRLEAAGAICMAKLATHEFALGGPDFDLPAPPARNPWNIDHVPGASSSGSAVAVAADVVPFALGTDTSGSVRGPAAACGVVGLKPTFGSVPRSGTFPLSYSLDHVGPLTHTSADASTVLEVLSGPDELDLSTRAPAVVTRPAGPIRLGVADNLHRSDITAAAVQQAIEWAAETFSRAGVIVDNVTAPPRDQLEACGRIIMMSEALSIHRRSFQDHLEEYGRFTRERILPAAVVSASDMTDALRLRQHLAQELAQGALANHDFLLTATSLQPPPKFDDFGAHWPPPSSATASNTIAFNVTGHPALAVPVGTDNNGLPLSVQLVGRAWTDHQLLRLGTILEDARPEMQSPYSARGCWGI